MKAVIQRVKSASVTVDGQLVSKIGRGLLVLAGVGKEDTEKDADTLIQRILKAKLFPSEEDKQGKQPDFHDAADAETARKLYDYFFRRLGEAYKPERVKNGIFQAMMEVELKNDGPVGVDYRSEDAAVTIEINTQLPKKEKSEKEEPSQPVQRNIEIKLPPELLE
ncbi:hypothetical protein APSETT445_008710 [Aspergillus pseudonomiae]